jgi:iron-sulfur cluster assembly protein
MIQLSQAAIAEINRLKMKQRHPQAVFRLEIQPGGCSEFHYVLKFDSGIKPTDQVLNCGGMSVVVDPQSLSCVSGLAIDYSEDLMGGGFRFHNPNATQNCGCGNSFSIA